MSQPQYDIIFAGGGTTACIVAGRLAAADPNLKILLIESGKHTQNISTHNQPARYYANLASGGDTFTFHVAKPSPALRNRPCIIPSGKGVGGGSSVNFLMYTRASPSDYDDWESLGNPGWGSADLIPLANKAETYGSGKSGAHGASGPIKILNVRDQSDMQTNTAKQFMAVAAVRDKERGFTDDANDFTVASINKYSPWSRYVSPETGHRSDTAHHYVYNQTHNKNLEILVHCRVKRVIFEENRAVGVEYLSHHPDNADQNSIFVARASKLVVLSGGAFGSPAILERSGIGSPDILKTCDIKQIVALPGVGENYNDHNLMLPPYQTTDDEVTLDDIFHGSDEKIKPHQERWLKDGQGLMAHNGIEAGIKIRPSQQDLEVLGPSFAQRWNEFFANHPDKPARAILVMCIATLSSYVGGNPAAPAASRHYTVCYYTEYPASLGRTHIKSTDPYTPLEVEPGFLDKEEDVAALRWAYKWSREMSRRMDAYRGEFAPDHPAFPEGSEAKCGRQDGPVPINAPDIAYTAEDDKAIDDYHRATISTTWHSLGTCAMKSREQNGVVDPRLNVYGVTGLKVADLSIAPTNVAANTYNSAIIVGERAAVIIAEDLGIKGV
ncbi:GMC-OxRdtase-N domain-containing protein [Mycena indigotica]|uniref:GMC-OxRdtase-N domain-containing protein n=1 Tax=Mycena indigotica TaxID=2126181 RepID=A0A8H6T7G0_9AGAR|nr:GMC-OxRdtase-N domain-containing protein [Mycena indigotica]KAF7312458.1 GMC-OxRdtase-N domain-containing protein [Mycena indigotica]